jgi:hypothetical protein
MVEQEAFLVLFYHSARRHMSKAAIYIFIYLPGKITIEFQFYFKIEARYENDNFRFWHLEWVSKYNV